jgi:hypothetical protein
VSSRRKSHICNLSNFTPADSFVMA